MEKLILIIIQLLILSSCILDTSSKLTQKKETSIELGNKEKPYIQSYTNKYNQKVFYTEKSLYIIGELKKEYFVKNSYKIPLEDFGNFISSKIVITEDSKKYTLLDNEYFFNSDMLVINNTSFTQSTSKFSITIIFLD